MKKNRKMPLLFLSALVMRLFYIIYTPITLRQHDAGNIEDVSGHLGYVAYLVAHGLHLPDFDPRNVDQFYHPPLHHTIAAIWVKFNMKLGFSEQQAYENVQILTVIYGMISIWIIYCILREFKVSEKSLCLSMMVLCFHPYLILMSGSINNDSLCIMLVLGAVYFSIRWYRYENMRNIIGIAICLGLSMLAKASGVFLAPAIGMLFLMKMWKCRGQILKWIKQYAIFGLVSIPIGISWSIYNLVKWGMPINYIPVVGKDSPQYLGDISIWRRLFDIRLPFGNRIFININGNEDYNVWITVLKEMVFDEYGIAADPLGVWGANLLFYINIALVVLLIAAILGTLLSKVTFRGIEWNIYFGTYFIVLLGMFLKFLFEYPYVCSMSARYIVPLLYVAALCLSLILDRWREKNRIMAIAQMVIILFCTCSCLEYLWVGYQHMQVL